MDRMILNIRLHLTRHLKSDSDFGSGPRIGYGTMCSLRQVYRQQDLSLHLNPIAKTIFQQVLTVTSEATFPSSSFELLENLQQEQNTKPL